MFVFKSEYTCKSPISVVFLCGCQYKEGNIRDKRAILKNYIVSNNKNTFPIILEENFCFGKTTKELLSYDNIFLKELASVEQLASLFADRIIIIHETLSTAAEIGMFATDTSLTSKICLLTPDKISVDENKAGGFIKLAYLNKFAHSGIENIIYYPDIEINRSSTEKCDYFTFFHEDCIGEKLGKSINSFLGRAVKISKLSFKEANFDKDSVHPQIISYRVLPQSKCINVSIHVEALKIQLLSLMFLPEVKEELREEKYISKHIDFLDNLYRGILKNTISNIYKSNIDDYTIDLHIRDSAVAPKQAIGYFLYLLQAMGFIKLIQTTNTTHTAIRKVQFTKSIKQHQPAFEDYIYVQNQSAYGDLEL